MVKVRHDLTGQVFERLKVIKRVEDYYTPKGEPRAQYLCECSCNSHTQIVIRADHLRSGNTKSCGCLSLEAKQKLCKERKQLNKYDLSGMYGIGYFYNSEQEFYFDLEDYEKIKDYRWYLNNNGYAIAWVGDKQQTLHSLIMGRVEGKEIDHKDRNRLNNQKSNLRFITHRNNSRNINIPKNNTSGFIGVYFDKKGNKWVASLYINKRSVCSKTFNNKEEAIKARLKAELEYYGIEYAPQRHLFEEYGIIE